MRRKLPLQVIGRLFQPTRVKLLISSALRGSLLQTPLGPHSAVAQQTPHRRRSRHSENPRQTPPTNTVGIPRRFAGNLRRGAIHHRPGTPIYASVGRGPPDEVLRSWYGGLGGSCPFCSNKVAHNDFHCFGLSRPRLSRNQDGLILPVTGQTSVSEATRLFTIK